MTYANGVFSGLPPGKWLLSVLSVPILFSLSGVLLMRRLARGRTERLPKGFRTGEQMVEMLCLITFDYQHVCRPGRGGAGELKVRQKTIMSPLGELTAV